MIKIFDELRKQIESFDKIIMPRDTTIVLMNTITDLEKKLAKARESMLKVDSYLKRSDDISYVNAVYISPHQELINAAREMEKRDADIRDFRTTLAEIE